jgi:hypothetical protein
MRDDYTHTTIVLDASKSMSSIKEAIIESFNSFFQEQAEVEGEMTTSLYEFSTEGVFKGLVATNDSSDHEDVRQTLDFASLDEGAPLELTVENYAVGGRTPLYDAMVKAIDQTGDRLAAMPESQRPANVIVLVLTDGIENASQADVEAVRSRVEEQQDTYDWEFLFVGADQDSVLQGGEVGIDASMTADFEPTEESTMTMMSATTRNISQYRDSGGDSAELRYDQNDDFTDPDSDTE